MAYLKEQIERLGKALGIKPVSVSVGVPNAHPAAAAQDTVVDQPSNFEASAADASGAPTIVGE